MRLQGQYVLPITAKAQLTSRDFDYAIYHADWHVFDFAVLFNEDVYRNPTLRKLLEESGRFDEERYFQRCVQIHHGSPHFDPRPLSPELAFSIRAMARQTTIRSTSLYANER